MQLAGSSRYLNFGGGVDAAGYGLRDHSGALQYKDSGGSWRTLGGPLEYDAGTGQYNVSLAQYVDSLDASVQEDAIRGIAFNNDGTKFYTVGQNSGNVNEYNLSPAYDISTATLVDSVSVTAQDAAPFGMAFNDTGTKLYIIGIIDSEINEYDLSPAYDTSTATFVDTLSLSAASVSPTGMAFNDTGTKLYVIDSTTDTINEYALSPAFDVSTAVFTDGLDVGAQETRPEGVTFNNEGTKLYVTGWGGDDVNEYDLSPAYDVSTASFVHRYIVSAQNNNPGDVVFNNDGTRFYVSSNIGGFVYEYRIPIIGRTYITNTSSYFGIGITEPLDPLHVAGNIRVGTGTTGCVKDANGTVISGTCSSDRKLKTDILPLGRASSTATAGLNAGSASTTRSLLDAFVALEPVTYRWNDLAASTFHHGTDELQTGLIAQQVRETLPELVSESSDGYLQIHFSDLPIYTIQALKELNTKVESIAVRSGIDMSGDLHGLRTYASAQFETLDAEVFTVGTADKPSGITLYDEDTNEPYCLRIKSGTLVYTSGACASNPPVDNAPKQEQPEPTEHTPPPPAPAPDESSEQPEDSEKTEADEAAPAGEQHDAAPETTDADTLSPESDQNETVQEPSEPIQSQTPPQTQPTTQQESEEVQPTQPLPEPQPEPEPEPQPDSQPDPAPDPENS